MTARMRVATPLRIRVPPVPAGIRPWTYPFHLSAPQPTRFALGPATNPRDSGDTCPRSFGPNPVPTWMPSSATLSGDAEMTESTAPDHTLRPLRGASHPPAAPPRMGRGRALVRHGMPDARLRHRRLRRLAALGHGDRDRARAGPAAHRVRRPRRPPSRRRAGRPARPRVRPDPDPRDRPELHGRAGDGARGAEGRTRPLPRHGRPLGRPGAGGDRRATAPRTCTRSSS